MRDFPSPRPQGPHEFSTPVRPVSPALGPAPARPAPAAASLGTAATSAAPVRPAATARRCAPASSRRSALRTPVQLAAARRLRGRHGHTARWDASRRRSSRWDAASRRDASRAVRAPAAPTAAARAPLLALRVRAALLNLSGLGAGYAFLRQWLFLGIALAVTAGLLVGAAWHGAADNPLIWAPVLLAWFLATAAHGLFAGRARDERTTAAGGQPPKRLAPVLTAAALAVAVLAGLAGVWQAGEWRLRVADATHARGDCDTAIDVYEQVEGGFQLSMSPSLMDRARDGVDACRLLAEAQDQVSQEEYDEALDTYSGYFAHPASRWEDTDGEVADTYLSHAGNIANETAETYAGEVTDEIRDGFQRAQQIYSVIPGDHEGTEAAGRVPDALADLYSLGTSDYAAERWCAAFRQIEVFVDLDWSAAPAVAERIEAEAPEAARQCGWAEVDGGSASTAEEMTDFLAARYPGHEADDVEDLVRFVGAARIGEEMDILTVYGETDFDARPTGSTDGDQVVMEVTNDSPHDMRFLYVGPDGVHDEVVTPGCEECGEYTSPPSGNSCFERGGEVMRVEFEPGEYRMLLVSDTGRSIPLHGTLDLSGGDRYETCLYLTREE
ncbi:DUF1109 domain-containing protein [Nocardiopsis sp. CNR-923]|uniref:DUF1109 domain-containing protein n=1 Tax=Nocardiopsis sp. CNR-923 TaxID=1904965 RepID=UPI0029170132|nr:DUF1109 domain-containing protein [Nocardiopsis sp. CNR-923]